MRGKPYQLFAATAISKPTRPSVTLRAKLPAMILKSGPGSKWRPSFAGCDGGFSAANNFLDSSETSRQARMVNPLFPWIVRVASAVSSKLVDGSRAKGPGECGSLPSIAVAE